MPNDVLTITQNDVNGADVRLTLVDKQELRVKRKKLLSTDEYRINILVLNEKSNKTIIFGWKWFVAGFVSCLLFTPKIFSLSFIPGLYQEIAVYAGFMASIYCFYMTWETTSLKQVFYSYSTHIPLVELAINNPSKKEFESFLQELEHSIREHRETSEVDPSQQLKGEIKTLRRLNKIGIVSEPDYESSKSILLNQM